MHHGKHQVPLVPESSGSLQGHLKILRRQHVADLARHLLYSCCHVRQAEASLRVLLLVTGSRKPTTRQFQLTQAIFMCNNQVILQ
ncbi:hypothetical protein WJX82_006108 [Trebouxia sp. C0006]